MQNPLKGLGDLNKLRKQAQEMQKALAAQTIEINEDGVEIAMTADQKIQSLTIDGQEDNRVKKAVERAIKEAQKVAAKQFASMSGGMSGLLGQ